MATPLTRIELDKAKCPCGNSNCDELWLKQRCHPTAGAVVSYDQKRGVLKVRCKVCGARMAEILVAKDLIVV